MSRKLKQHSMAYTTGIAQQAVANVSHFLQTHWPGTVAIHSVEDDPAYQKFDVDLLWSVVEHGRIRTIPIEIKGDTYHQTGNFFFETVSNEGRSTNGCFLYTAAKWLFYDFIGIERLYCLPLAHAQPWFANNMDRFHERRTSTPTAAGSHYITVGRLVPIDMVLTEVPGVLVFQKAGDQWTAVTDHQSGHHPT